MGATAQNRSRPGSPDQSGGNFSKFSQPMKRPTSGKMRHLSAAITFSEHELEQRVIKGGQSLTIEDFISMDVNAITSPMKDTGKSEIIPMVGGSLEIEKIDGKVDETLGTGSIGSLEETSLTLKGNGVDKEEKVSRISRNVVVTEKSTKRDFMPMRFRLEPTDLTLNKSVPQRSKNDYMQNYDSDEEQDMGRQFINTTKSMSSASPRAGTAGDINAKTSGGGGRGKKSAGKTGKSAGGIGKLPPITKEKAVIRERPISAQVYRQIVSNDLELSVHLRHANSRRMPLTSDAEKWLDDRETERIKRFEEEVTAILTAAASKGDKKKDKSGDKKDKKDKGKKKDKKKKEHAEDKPKPICKYKSASHFMSVHFPSFDSDGRVEGQGPMRRQQLLECAEILEAFEDTPYEIKESALIKGLVIPQDRPESLCAENLKGPYEGLMVNPLPKEYWRKLVKAGKKGGKKGGKKKKK